MSVEGERASSGRQSTNVNHRFEHSLTTFRSKLLPDILEVIEVCVAMYRNGNEFSQFLVSRGIGGCKLGRRLPNSLMDRCL